MHYNSPTRNNTALNLVEEDERLAAPVHAGCAHDVQAAQLDGRTATDAAAAGTRRGRRQRSAKIEGEASLLCRRHLSRMERRIRAASDCFTLTRTKRSYRGHRCNGEAELPNCGTKVMRLPDTAPEAGVCKMPD